MQRGQIAIHYSARLAVLDCNLKTMVNGPRLTPKRCVNDWSADAVVPGWLTSGICLEISCRSVGCQLNLYYEGTFVVMIQYAFNPCLEVW